MCSTRTVLLKQPIPRKRCMAPTASCASWKRTTLSTRSSSQRPFSRRLQSGRRSLAARANKTTSPCSFSTSSAALGQGSLRLSPERIDPSSRPFGRICEQFHPSQGGRRYGSKDFRRAAYANYLTQLTRLMREPIGRWLGRRSITRGAASVKHGSTLHRKVQRGVVLRSSQTVPGMRVQERLHLRETLRRTLDKPR